MPKTELEPLMSEEDTANVLGMSPRTLEGKRLRGEPPPYVKLGKRVMYRPSDIAAYVNANVRHSTSERKAS
jgi:hypothetical protein